MNKFIEQILVLIFIGIIATSCSNKSKSQLPQDTPTRGNTKIAVDESFSLLFDTQIYTFESIYHYAKIQADYLPELDVFDQFLKDSVRVIVATRKLTGEEDTFLRQQQIIPKTTKIAYDALALVVNTSNRDTLLKYYEIKDIFSGKINQWSQINPKSKLGEIELVFDHIESGNVRYFNEHFELKGKFPSRTYVTESNAQVVDYVESHKNAIGVVSVNWVSDKHDSVSQSFLNKVKVLAITASFDPDGYDYYRPYQAYIADGSYPFIREVYMINRETYTGLGSGFLQFVAGEVGQRIILKSRLLPATMPIRVVQVKNNM